ncbi:ATP-binding protein [uncultured Pseudokineococcus sp.]|uniref:sensor histidine kinase n=1 Tax=uncultured Pseudokineococcus sp. TaxID=1642928 RepID=UPI0026051247|nr:ATP-binding protein [uncultured Pseudokineococcus sp.]
MTAVGRPPVLRRHGLESGAQEEELAAVARLAVALTGLPAAAVHLLDPSHQHRVAAVGCPLGSSPRESSMCASVVESGEAAVVADAREDARFRSSPWVTGARGRVRAYVSVPVVADDGAVVGTVCAFGEEPLAAGEDGVRSDVAARLEDLARLVVQLLEGRRRARLQEDLVAHAEEQRLLAELTLREAEERSELIQAVLDSVEVGIVAADPDGRVTLFNRTALGWHGLDADPALEQVDHPERYDLFCPDGATPLRREDIPLHRALEHGEVSGAEMVIAPPGLPARHVVSTGRALVRADGARSGAVVAMSDVTAERAQRLALQDAHGELVRREQELVVLVAELERSNADLEHFAAVAGHDLASPLGVVAGYVELLGDVYADQLGEQGRGWVQTCLRGAGRMQALITALLDHARAGSASCRPEPTDLRELLDQAVGDLATAVGESGARITAGPLPTTSCDPTLVRQLLQNLLGNAVRYRRADRTCEVVVSAARAADGWEVAVADNGTGVPPEQREGVFDVFTRLDPASGAGHGLGLATCRRIVERHGGRIWLDASPGGGTTARFVLPDGRGPGRPAGVGEAGDRSGARVLDAVPVAL